MLSSVPTESSVNLVGIKADGVDVHGWISFDETSFVVVQT